MQKLRLEQKLSQKLSPQQIQFIKLLQVPTVELAARIEEELENNPLLEEGRDKEETAELAADSPEPEFDEEYQEDTASLDEVNLDDYVNHDDISGYKMYGDGPSGDEEERDMPISSKSSLVDSLLDQLSYLPLNDRQKKIGQQLIGSIDEDGYIRRDLEAIVNDLAFTQNLETNIKEIEAILRQIQQFDPPGIAARDLKECLYLQLMRKERHQQSVKIAMKIVMTCFEEFKKKHYNKIEKRLSLSDDELKEAISLITKLNPKPGGIGDSGASVQYLTPDFIVKEDSGQLKVMLNSKNAPELRISRDYAEMIDTYDKAKKKDKKIKQTVTFVKQKLDAAKWFIDAIKQRQDTLLRTMQAIVDYQYDFFLSGDESKLRPMILKDIADTIKMDISTISRVANSKAVQTDFGLFPLKFFFSESISTTSGEDVSSKEVKYILKSIIDGEDKRKPLADDKLERMLKEKGYKIARRTVAKYREQLNIPVARLRKQL